MARQDGRGYVSPFGHLQGVSISDSSSTPQTRISDAAPALITRSWLILPIHLCVSLYVDTLIQSLSPGFLLRSRGSLTIIQT